MPMTRTLLLGTALAVGSLPLAPAMAQQMDKAIEQIDVRVDFSSFENANALDYYPDLEGDLEAALGDELSGFMDDEGGHLQVVVNEMSMGGDSALSSDAMFDRLSAGVFYLEPNQIEPESASANVPETDSVAVVATGNLDASNSAVYEAMIDGLAEEIAKRFPTL